MRTMQIKVGKLKTLRIRQFQISHCPGKHAMLSVEGYINDEEIDEVKRMSVSDTTVQIQLLTEHESKQWYGYVYDIEIQHMPHETYIRAKLISQSVTMDKEKKTRSFQTEGTTIGQIIEYVCKDYDVKVNLQGTDQAMDKMIVQYEETDWEFIKRLASGLNEQVIVRPENVGLVLDIGLSETKGTCREAPDMYTYRSDIQALRRNMEYELGEADIDTIIFESTELYDIEDAVQTERGKFYLYKISSEIQNEELVMKYTGYRKQNFKTPKVSNTKIVGASLNGKVHAVSGSKVQVDLDVDADNPLCGNKDFSYATVYSSESGTGWYCMPEIGDMVRVYFPSEKEKNAYAISSVHLDVQTNDSRSNPDIKSISNAQNKQVVFAPDGILIQNTENMYISLNDENGITIVSDLPICIHSDMNIALSAGENIEIGGARQVAIKQGECATTIKEEGAPVEELPAPTTEDATILMSEGKITVSGVEFRLQENEGA